MAEAEVALNGALTRELVADVIARIRANEKYAANQAATGPVDPHKIAEWAIYEVWTDLQDYLGNSFGVTLASYGITADGAPAHQ